MLFARRHRNFGLTVFEAEQLEAEYVTPDVAKEEHESERRLFLMQIVQPGLAVGFVEQALQVAQAGPLADRIVTFPVNPAFASLRPAEGPLAGPHVVDQRFHVVQVAIERTSDTGRFV